jgi:hypothetical protein
MTEELSLGQVEFAVTEITTEKVGIVETKEFILGAIKLGKFVAVQAKNGLDWTDALALGKKLAEDAEFRGALLAAVIGVQNIPAEVKDLKWDEGVEIVTAAFAELRA